MTKQVRSNTNPLPLPKNKPTAKKKERIDLVSMEIYTPPKLDSDDRELLDLFSKISFFQGMVCMELLNTRSLGKHDYYKDLKCKLGKGIYYYGETILGFMHDKPEAKVCMCMKDEWYNEFGHPLWKEAIEDLFKQIMDLQKKVDCPCVKGALGGLAKSLGVAKYILVRGF